VGQNFITASVPAAWDVGYHQCGAELKNGVSASSGGCTNSVGRQYHGLCCTTSVGCKFHEPSVRMYYQCGAELKNGMSATSVGCTIRVGQNLRTALVPAAWDVPLMWGVQCRQMVVT